MGSSPASLKLTFEVDHSAGANQFAERAVQRVRLAAPDGADDISNVQIFKLTDLVTNATNIFHF
jgi:hypothetical protein